MFCINCFTQFHHILSPLSLSLSISLSFSPSLSHFLSLSRSLPASLPLSLPLSLALTFAASRGKACVSAAAEAQCVGEKAASRHGTAAPLLLGVFTDRAVFHYETSSGVPKLCRPRCSTDSSRVDRPLVAR